MGKHEELVKRLRRYTEGCVAYKLDADFAAAVQQAAEILEAISAADVRPVVLCRDCKWYQIDELKKDGTEDRRYKPSVCVLAEQRRDPNHFCADGKKREES